MSSALLPPNSTRLERALADALAAATDIDVAIRDLWRPDDCPPAFLPYLAWALSVDEWNADWPDATKRAVIRASLDVHRRKGSPASVRKALEAISFNIDLTEWFETGAPPHTFALDAFAEDVFEAGFAVDGQLLAMVERLIDKTKPVREHYILRIGETFRSDIHIRTGVRDRYLSQVHHDPVPRTAHATAAMFMRAGARPMIVSRMVHEFERRAA